MHQQQTPLASSRRFTRKSESWESKQAMPMHLFNTVVSAFSDQILLPFQIGFWLPLLNLKVRTDKIRYREFPRLLFKSIRKIEIHENETLGLTKHQRVWSMYKTIHSIKRLPLLGRRIPWNSNWILYGDHRLGQWLGQPAIWVPENKEKFPEIEWHSTNTRIAFVKRQKSKLFMSTRSAIGVQTALWRFRMTLR